MAQVSQRPLPQALNERIYDVLWKTIAGVRDKQAVADLLDDLLTRTEKTMLAKRLSIAVMLTKGYNYLTISDALKVSTATILTVKGRMLDGKGYRAVVVQLLRDDKVKKLLGKVEEMFGALVESRPYSPRWTEEQKVKHQARQKRNLPV